MEERGKARSGGLKGPVVQAGRTSARSARNMEHIWPFRVVSTWDKGARSLLPVPAKVTGDAPLGKAALFI